MPPGRAPRFGPAVTEIPSAPGVHLRAAPERYEPDLAPEPLEPEQVARYEPDEVALAEPSPVAVAEPDEAEWSEPDQIERLPDPPPAPQALADELPTQELPAVVPAQPVPPPTAGPAPTPVPLPAAVPPPRAAGLHVELGFRDGTRTELDPESEQALALAELAAVLTESDPA